MQTLLLSKFLPEYEDIGWDFLETMIYAHQETFDVYKLEKDFYLTLLLVYFGKHCPELVFKGGTCLNKIYYPYCRLSEDIDFVIQNEGGFRVKERILGEYKKLFLSEVFQPLGLHFPPQRTTFDNKTQ